MGKNLRLRELGSFALLAEKDDEPDGDEMQTATEINDDHPGTGSTSALHSMTTSSSSSGPETASESEDEEDDTGGEWIQANQRSPTRGTSASKRQENNHAESPQESEAEMQNRIMREAFESGRRGILIRELCLLKRHLSKVLEQYTGTSHRSLGEYLKDAKLLKNKTLLKALRGLIDLTRRVKKRLDDSREGLHIPRPELVNERINQVLMVVQGNKSVSNEDRQALRNGTMTFFKKYNQDLKTWIAMVADSPSTSNDFKVLGEPGDV